MPNVYVIVELKDQDEVSSIVNILLERKNRFTVTDDIEDYARSRPNHKVDPPSHADLNGTHNDATCIQRARVKAQHNLEKQQQLQKNLAPTEPTLRTLVGMRPSRRISTFQPPKSSSHASIPIRALRGGGSLKRRLPQTTEVIKVLGSTREESPNPSSPSTLPDDTPMDDNDVKPELLALFNDNPTLEEMLTANNDVDDDDDDDDLDETEQELNLIDPTDLINLYASSDTPQATRLPARRPTFTRNRKRPNQSFQCKICKAYIKVRGYDYHKRSTHAIIHSEIMRYQCPYDSCTFKNRHRSDICRHLRLAHNVDPNYLRIPECMSKEESRNLREVVLQCFPEMAPAMNGEKTQMRMADFETAKQMNSDEMFFKIEGVDPDDLADG